MGSEAGAFGGAGEEVAVDVAEEAEDLVVAELLPTIGGRGQVGVAVDRGLVGVPHERLEGVVATLVGEGVEFGEATPRAGNDSGGGQPGRILKCKGWETDPDAYTYFITQAAVWKRICDVIGRPEWKEDPDYATPPARLPRLNEVFDAIEQWTMTKTKYEVMEICNPLDIPVGPILSMKELADEASLRETGTIVECDHPERGPYLSVGCPVKLSHNDVVVTRSPLLGEHTAEILREVLGYSGDDLERVVASGAVGDLPQAAE